MRVASTIICLFLCMRVFAFDELPVSTSEELRKLLGEVSTERIRTTMQKLESFETRDVHSETESSTRGIGAARRWLHEELRSYSPKLQVRFDSFFIKKQGRIQRDLELVNVVAVLEGTTQKDRQVMLSGHYDSLVLVRKPGAAAGDPEGVDYAASAKAPKAPGVSDDASGVAAVLEIARLMSQRTWKKTMVFVLFAGEEQGLVGSRLMAERMQSDKQAIDALLNSDIIGNDKAGNGEARSRAVRVFSPDPADSPSRALARYVQRVGGRYVPGMAVELVYRHDRFGRGGDHTPFAQKGFPAVRFTTPSENYANQHTVTDTMENASPDYAARVAKVKLAVAASLASAPRTPGVTRELPASSDRGTVAPLLTRGKSGYDAVLKWTAENDEDLAGFSVVSRKSASPDWEREEYVGNVREWTYADLSIDDIVLGVKAIGKSGWESPVAAYQAVERPDRKIELAGTDEPAVKSTN